MRYILGMKTATIPPVRIDPALRQDIEDALVSGETLASLVETAVRHEVSRRQAQTEFVRRGLAAINLTVSKGGGLSVDDVLTKLQKKLAKAKRTLKHDV